MAVYPGCGVDTAWVASYAPIGRARARKRPPPAFGAQGGSAEAATCDAANSKDVAALAATVMQTFPRLDIAVTTPGLNIRKTILDYTEEDLDRVINASEVGRFGVRVNAIAPSIVETALTAPFKERPEIFNLYAGHTVFNRWSSADEVATAVAYLGSDAASYVSGSTLFVDGGWTALDGPPTGLTQLAK